MLNDLYSFSIMPLNLDYIEEICLDCKDQYETGVCSCVLFCMTLVPEGNPVVDKAEILCNKYDIFKKKLDEMKVYKEFRENLEKYNKNEIRSKDLYLILKNDEMENLRIAIDEFAVDKEVNLDTFSAIKYSSLIRKYKKLKKQIDSIEDYSDDDFDNLVHDEIVNYRKRQNKKKAPRTDKLGKPKNI